MTITKVKFANEGLETGWIYIERPNLTDEEIMEIYNDQANRDFQLRSDPFKFARAILKKASEK